MQEPLSMTDLSEGMAFIQGEYCPIAEAKIPILDQAVMTSDGTYDALHVWNGAFFRLDDHLDRLERSTQRLRLKIPYEREALVGILMELVRRSGMRDCFLEIIVSRGVARPAVRDIDLYTKSAVHVRAAILRLRYANSTRAWAASANKLGGADLDPLK